jgi:hypothetical protein
MGGSFVKRALQSGARLSTIRWGEGGNEDGSAGGSAGGM